jgi:hypothetical protein
MKLGDPHMDGLIKKYSEARGKEKAYSGDREAMKYWQGAGDVYRTILTDLYPDWTKSPIGRLVFFEDMSYDDAWDESFGDTDPAGGSGLHSHI